MLEGRPGTKLKVMPTNLLDFTLARYIRFRFQGLHTTLHNVQWLVDRKELNKRSFYSLRYIKIGARLDCNGHALRPKQYNDDEVCATQSEQDQTNFRSSFIIRFYIFQITECDCAHNTCGINCEKCCPLYNQTPYKQGTATDSNKCEKCEVCNSTCWIQSAVEINATQCLLLFFYSQCHGHSNECYYNPEVDHRKLSINTDGVYSGGGVCLNCTVLFECTLTITIIFQCLFRMFILQDFTTGINCQKCISNYYRPEDVSPSAKNPCIPCECNPIGTVGTCSSIGGNCSCKVGFSGSKCSECAPGYSGPNCQKCPCDSRGTMPGGECEAHCQCKVIKNGTWKLAGDLNSFYMFFFWKPTALRWRRVLW